MLLAAAVLVLTGASETAGLMLTASTSALSLKLSEIKLVENITNTTPILLLDDVLSELDSSRQNFLLNSIGEIQTIITCTGLDEFINNRIKINKIFKVYDGKVISEN